MLSFSTLVLIVLDLVGLATAVSVWFCGHGVRMGLVSRSYVPWSWVVAPGWSVAGFHDSRARGSQ